MANNERLFVDKLAEVIRNVDGDHTMGAGALADAIVDSGIIFELEEVAREEGYNQGYENALDAAAWDASYPND
mgnify:CR=1 FL=1